MLAGSQDGGPVLPLCFCPCSFLCLGDPSSFSHGHSSRHPPGSPSWSPPLGNNPSQIEENSGPLPPTLCPPAARPEVLPAVSLMAGLTCILLPMGAQLRTHVRMCCVSLESPSLPESEAGSKNSPGNKDTLGAVFF